MAALRYKAFISYSHRDDRWATWLHRALESYRPPRNLVGTQTANGTIPSRLSPIFRDRDELPSATDLGTIIDAALRDSECQIVICSPAAAKSRWVNEEILAYKRLGRAHRILSLIVAGEPNATDIPGREDEECFPPALRFQVDADDGRLTDRRTEPIAADAREGKDGRTNAKIKVVAGMLGVGFDALRRREHVRAQRRMALITGSSLGGMLVTTVLAVSAWLARTEAVQQRIRAQSEAETSRQVTSFMVGLFKVSDPSESLGNTITAREILDRGAKRIEYELADQPAVRATLMDTVGTVYSSLGLYNQAEDMLKHGLWTREKLYGANNPVVAKSQASIGNVLGRRAQYAEAAKMYETAIATLRAAKEPDPAGLAQSLYGLAEVRRMQADHAGAEKLLREAIDLQRKVAHGDSLEVARSLGELGLSAAQQTRYADAEKYLRESLAMYRRLIPGGVHPQLSDSLNDLAAFLYEAGRYDEAQKLFREALDVNTRMLGDKHPAVANSLNNLAFVLQDSGKRAEAEQYFKRALDIRVAALGEKHPATAQTINNLAFLYHDQGKLQRAIEYERRAVTIYRASYQGDHPEIAFGLQNLASWLVEAGDYEEARPMLEEALGINRRTLPEGHPDIAITRCAMAFYLLKTQSFDDALAQSTAADEALTKALGTDHWRVAWARALEGASLAKLGRHAEAEPLLVQSYDALRKVGAQASQADITRKYLVELYDDWHRPADAARFRAMRTLAAR